MAASAPAGHGPSSNVDGARGESHKAYNDRNHAEGVDQTMVMPVSLTAAHVELNIVEERFHHVLVENMALLKQVEMTNKDLERSRAEEEELSATWKATNAVSARQKMAVQGLVKNAQSSARAESTRLVEAAQHVQDLQDVYKRLQSVNRQLEFAQQMQAWMLADVEHRIIARTGRTRKVEQAIYRVFYQAQRDGGFEEVLSGLVAKCGPLVRSVLAREAQRQALQMATAQVSLPAS